MEFSDDLDIFERYLEDIRLRYGADGPHYPKNLKAKKTAHCEGGYTIIRKLIVSIGFGFISLSTALVSMQAVISSINILTLFLEWLIVSSPGIFILLTVKGKGGKK